MHLQVSDLARAQPFYHGLLGLDVTQRDYPGALFLAAGGYHHHLGLNIWVGTEAPPPPPDAVGLVSFGLRIPDEEAWHDLAARIETAGVPMGGWRQYERAVSLLIHDPDRNGVELVVERAALSPKSVAKLGKAEFGGSALQRQGADGALPRSG